MNYQTAVPGREIRCAIYTRRSVDLSPSQEFNTLEAQRAICSSYIASQRPKGWTEVEKHYDDAGRTGANLRRPGLQELLTDLESGLIDAVIVYKLDRITRTLVDFVRLADLFESYGVKFVSVTQNFDTGDSTGRLILNVLLTFAQFEREISSDRLRDKFSTMKERGMFIGGHPPYGFDLVNKKLVVNTAEAATVRWAFRRYLAVESYTRVARELAAKGVVRRDRVSKRGNLVKGRPISTSSVWTMLENPIYAGEVRYHNRRYPGVQDAIVSRDLWEKVQALRIRRTRAKVVEIHKTDLLRGLMHDAYGRTVGVFRDYRHKKEGTRYYLSNQSEWGRRNGVRRFRTKADELDRLVMAAITSCLADRGRVRAMLVTEGVHDGNLNALTKSAGSSARMLEQSTPMQAQCALRALIEGIELSEDNIRIIVRLPEVRPFLEWSGIGVFRGHPEAWSKQHKTALIEIPTSTLRIKRDLGLLAARRGRKPTGKPNRHLLSLVRRARDAQAMLDARREINLTAMAEELHCTPSRLSRLVRLNYLAPDIIAAILDGDQPHDLTGHKLMATDLPMDWSLQRKILGFADQPDMLKAAPGW